MQNEAIVRMNQCKNLDDFYDILFMVEDTLIKANSLVLKTRCPYFASMLSSDYNFSECQIKRGSSIRVEGVPKIYFQALVQYIYSDHFFIQRNNIDFFVKLLIFADYFLLPRLVDICSSYLKQFVTVNSTFSLLLLAQSHNAAQLERYCIQFISMNESEIYQTKAFHMFRLKADPKLYTAVMQKVSEEIDSSFIQISIANFQNKENKAAKLSEDTRNRKSSYGRRQPDSQTTQVEEEDEDETLDIDEILNASAYIYMEE